jgi:hypothetical protein
MKQPVIKFETVHWWIALLALLVGLFVFFSLHRHAYCPAARRKAGVLALRSAGRAAIRLLAKGRPGPQ